MVDLESNDIVCRSIDSDRSDCDGLEGLLAERELQVCCISASTRCGLTCGNVGAWDVVDRVGVASVSMTAIAGGDVRASAIAWVVVSNNGGLGLVHVSVMLVLLVVGGLVMSVLLRVVIVWVVGVSTHFQSKDGSSGG